MTDEKMKQIRRALTKVKSKYGFSNGTRADGGPGSGYYNHPGRPGQVGGSAAGGGGAGGGGAAWQAKCEKDRTELLGKKLNQQAMEIYHTGFLDQKTAVQQMRDGTISESVNRYYDLLIRNGDPTPTKQTVSKQKNVAQIVKETGRGYDEVRLDEIIKDTGFSKEEARETKKAVDRWTTSVYQLIDGDRERLDRYIERAPTYSGKIYRGMSFTREGSYESFMDTVRTGTVRMKGNSSWTSDEDVGRRFSHFGQRDIDSVQIVCHKNRTATPLEHLSTYGGEDEVLAHSRAQWSVMSINEWTEDEGGRKAVINVMETGEFADE